MVHDNRRHVSVDFSSHTLLHFLSPRTLQATFRTVPKDPRQLLLTTPPPPPTPSFGPVSSQCPLSPLAYETCLQFKWRAQHPFFLLWLDTRPSVKRGAALPSSRPCRLVNNRSAI